jgi:hypothetical protein
MKRRIALTLLALVAAAGAAAQITLVNMIPASRSGEVNQDAEPSLSVNPANPLQIAGSAFTWDNLTGPPMMTDVAPTFYSKDGGLTWDMAMNIPSHAGSTNSTGDINIRFSTSSSGTTSMLYAGILHEPEADMWTLRCPDYRTNTLMEHIDTRTNDVDQPHVTAITSLRGDAGHDHLYVGFNNGCCMVSPDGHTSSIVWSLDAVNAAIGTMTLTPVEARSTGTPDQDGFATVSAEHPDGTVYAAFYGWRDWGPGGMSGYQAVTDVVVVRDDHSGNDNFASLQSGGVAGFQVITNQPMWWYAMLGNTRLGASNMAIAVDPNNSSRVYLAWADLPPQTLNQTIHLRESTTRGASWGPDLLTIQDAISPALAINSHGTIGFLYQVLVNNGQNWQTIFRRTTDAAGTVFDAGVTLSNTSSAAPAPKNQPYLGDYMELLAHGRDFYGVFPASNYPDTARFLPGVKYQRYVDWAAHKLYADAALTMPVAVSIDPFFFHSVEIAPSDDYYVRDWTDSASSGDDGAEPSTHAKFYVSSDVWNRRGTLTGAPFANDQPDNKDAGNGAGIIGDNWAFARVRRNASGDSGSVTAHFVVSPLGTGSNYADDSTVPGLDMSAPDPPALDFAAGETGPKITVPYHWHLDPVVSTHLCLAVQIDSANDHPLDPPLAGHAPGWGSGTDLKVLNDNNKAQRNMHLSTTPATGIGGMAGDWAIIHNAATFTRDFQLRYDVRNPFGERARIRVAGGDDKMRRDGDTLILPRMRPGENRWLEVSLPADALHENETKDIGFYELKNGNVVNGFAIGIRGGSMDDAIRYALTNLASVFTRLGTLYGSAAATKLGIEAQAQSEKKLDDAGFGAFIKSATPLIERSLADLDKAAGDDDPFDTKSLARGLTSPVAVTTLNNALDSRITRIELAKGNAADIPQTVRWQADLLASPKLANLPCAAKIANDARALDAAFDARKATWRDYPSFVRNSSDCLGAAAKLAGADIRSNLDIIERSPADAVRLQKAHSDILNKLAEFF